METRIRSNDSGDTKEQTIEKQEHLSGFEERKDAYSIDPNDVINTIETPSFIRLFVIRRIVDKLIDKYIIKTSKRHNQQKILIQELAKVFNDNKEMQSSVINIVTRLINDGLKKYMQKWYDQEKDANIIEDIFNKIILQRFSKEYNELITFVANNNGSNNNNNNNNNDKFYQNLIFNSPDLMSRIFEYLEWGWDFTKDLFACSLVNSHWLYGSWNVNAVYRADLTGLFDKTLKYEQNQKNDESNYNNIKFNTRLWQRFIHAKSIYLRRDIGAVTPESIVLKKLSMMTKIENVDLYLFGSTDSSMYVTILKALIGRCKDRIKNCCIRLGGTANIKLAENKLPPLQLRNVQRIKIDDLYLYQIWTDKCTELLLKNIEKISKNWCQFVIKNCDCSNIDKLILSDITFDKISMNENILKQLAVKFIKLKEIKFEFVYNVDKIVLAFWQLLILEEIISKNNKSKVELRLTELSNDETILLNQTMIQLDLKIEKLVIGNWTGGINSAIKFIQQRDEYGGVEHLVIGADILEQGTRLLNQISFKSINVFELTTSYFLELSQVNECLRWDKVIEKQLCLIIDITINLFDDEIDEILVLFESLCDNILQLFIKQIGLDIRIVFDKVKDIKLFDSFLSLYTTYFENKELIVKYKQPKCKCNADSYSPRDKPYTYFYVNQQDTQNKRCVMRATNVHCPNV